MKSQTTLVRTDSRVELNSHRIVDLNLSLVINPGNSEKDLALGSGKSLKKSLFTILFLMSLDNDSQLLKNFLDCLMQLWLSGVLCYHTIINFIYV